MAQHDNYVRQIGGTHYGTGYGHWDYCKDLNVPYLLGCATKYLVRWRDKNGIEDLRKALSYLDKQMIDHENFRWVNPANAPEGSQKLSRMLNENYVPDTEAMLIISILTYRDHQDLVIARMALSEFIENEERQAKFRSDMAAGANSAYTNQGK